MRGCTRVGGARHDEVDLNAPRIHCLSQAVTGRAKAASDKGWKLPPEHKDTHCSISVVCAKGLKWAWYIDHVPTPMKDTAEQTWSTRTLLAWIEGHLAERSIEEPGLVARWLMSRAIGTDPIHLYTDLDRPASAQERATLRELVKRASANEPVQYLLGKGGFLGRQFEVGPGVLIPRTATEGIVQHVLTWHRGLDRDVRPDPLWIADIGTGSGCIGITLALQLPTARVVAVDVSVDAVAFAMRNASTHEVEERVEIVEGNLCEPLKGRGREGCFDVIVSNPPYIGDARYEQLQPNVKSFEPALALRGGSDGLDIVRTLFGTAPKFLSPGGVLVVETDDINATEACHIAESTGTLVECRVLKDEFGDKRFVRAERSSA
jgi:release factor glutamine methyltransferase